MDDLSPEELFAVLESYIADTETIKRIMDDLGSGTVEHNQSFVVDISFRSYSFAPLDNTTLSILFGAALEEHFRSDDEALETLEVEVRVQTTKAPAKKSAPKKSAAPRNPKAPLKVSKRG